VPDKLPFFFAGIWRPWTGDRGTKKTPNVGEHTLFSIMTTEPNGLVEPIHEQAMPVLLMTSEAKAGSAPAYDLRPLGGHSAVPHW
jgi:putative SOS response-associated peptidase YedK